ncbi:MAG: bacillithiol biosynthesis cysteine-adding enzyme BshC [Chlamydiota bacterium]
MRVLEEVKSRQYRRDELVDILTQYNQSIGNDECAIENIQRLKHMDSVCVFTGQQLGFMGGPAYTFYKAIGCLQHAKQLGAIPIFWLATEDHDIAEIDHTYTVDDMGNMQKHKITLPIEGVVEDLVLTSRNVDEITSFCQQTGVDLSEVSFSAGDSYSGVMARLFTALFRGTGLVFVEPHLIRYQAEELFVREIKNHQEIYNLLTRHTRQMQLSGLPTPIEFVENGTNLFYKDDRNRRLKVKKDQEGFLLGDLKFNESELIELLHNDPSLFSGNVALRPIIQSYVFPTVAYVAGPTEVDYFQQLQEIFRYHDVPEPEVVPRPSITLLNDESDYYLNRIGLQPYSEIPNDWGQIFSDFAHKDKKEVKGLLENKGVPYYALHYLKNYLRPFNGPQERSLNWLWLNAQSQGSIVKRVLSQEPFSSKIHYHININEPKR